MAEDGPLTWPAHRPQSLYIHVPFCRHRCGYCNFTLVAGRDHLVERYLAALFREMDLWAAGENRVADPLRTVYFGGGTPTQLDAPALERLVTGVLARFPLETGAEVTIEANPGDLTTSRLRQLADLGFNRISLGVQSLQPAKLALLERDHDAAAVREAVEQAKRFARSVSVDLIFGTPGETAGDWERDLRAALALGPDHVSAYELTWERGTTFWSRRSRGELVEIPEELRLAMFEATADVCREYGLAQYEVSSYARGVGHRSRHNRVYWSGAPWLAFGPGAASFVGGVRVTRHRGVLQYLRLVEAGCLQWETDWLPPRMRAAEILCVGLRQLDGIDPAEFGAFTGQPVGTVAPAVLEQLRAERLAEWDAGRLRLTRRGLLWHDHVASRIMTEAASRSG